MLKKLITLQVSNVHCRGVLDSPTMSVVLVLVLGVLDTFLSSTGHWRQADQPLRGGEERQEVRQVDTSQQVLSNAGV